MLRVNFMLHVFYHRKNGGQIKKKMGKKSLFSTTCVVEKHIWKKKNRLPIFMIFS